MSAVFFDSNILIYTLAEHDPREPVAAALLARGGVISVQVLNEFVAVARRKLRLSWPEVIDALAAIRACCPPPRPLSLATHEAALGLGRKRARIGALARRCQRQGAQCERQRSGKTSAMGEGGAGRLWGAAVHGVYPEAG
jgi:hypothetical protein